MADRKDVVQGTLDLLVLRIIAAQPMHGWGVMQRHAVPDRGRLSGHDRIALSSAPAARGQRMGVRLLGCLREQPEGAVLRDHEGGTEAAGP